MAISFPSNPSLYDTYTYNDKKWTYNGTRWVATGAATAGSTLNGVSVQVATTAPAATKDGMLWVDADTGVLSVALGGQWVTVLGSGGISTVVADGSITAAKLDPNLQIGVADGAVTTAKLADGSVTTAKLAGNVSLGGAKAVGYSLIFGNQ